MLSPRRSGPSAKGLVSAGHRSRRSGRPLKMTSGERAPMRSRPPRRPRAGGSARSAVHEAETGPWGRAAHEGNDGEAAKQERNDARAHAR